MRITVIGNHNSILRNSPYGNAEWMKKTAEQMGLQATLRQRGRPRKRDEDGEK